MSPSKAAYAPAGPEWVPTFLALHLFLPKAMTRAFPKSPWRQSYIQVISQCLPRSYSTPTYSPPAPAGASEAEVQSAKNYCSSLLQYDALQTFPSQQQLTPPHDEQEIRLSLPHPPRLHPSPRPIRLPRPPRLQHRNIPHRRHRLHPHGRIHAPTILAR